MESTLYSYDDEIKPLDHIDFCILSNEEIKRGSALGKDSIGIDIPDLYDNLEPKRGGLIDPRLGVIDNNRECDTCGLGNTECVGHHGHIDVVEPVFHIGYLDYVKRILSCVCLKCSKLLVYKTEEEIAIILKTKSTNARFNEIKNLSKNIQYCQKQNYGCGTPVSKIKKEIKKLTCDINIIAETTIAGLDNATSKEKKKIRQILTPEDCYNILKNISDTDSKILGIDTDKSRPESMIHKTLYVPPVQTRPSVKADFMGSSSLEDDLTHKLAEIVKANIRTRRYKETSSQNSAKYIQDHCTFLQYHVATYYDNSIVSLPKSEQKSKIIRSVTARIPGKTGRIRGNLMGKRVDFSARTVITPDPNIDINQIGIPIWIAMALTFPEQVTSANIEFLQTLVKNGHSKYPGANFVYPGSYNNNSNPPIYLKYKKDQVILRIGDIVERHLLDGDYVLLNRQPTLHKLSMMAHKVKVLEDENLKTFRVNPAVTGPYGADFDGDEMNIFPPQSLSTLIELSELADVKRQIISPRLSAPIIGVIQDGLIGSYLLTNPNMKIKRKDALNILSYTNIDFKNFVEIFKNKKLTEISGQEVYSLIIPKNVNITDLKNNINITNGNLTQGQIGKKQIGGGSANSIIHLVWDENGEDASKDFIDNSQRLINNFNLLHGFTVGIQDTYITSKIYEELNVMFETKRVKLNCLVTEVENNPYMYDESSFEQIIYSELNNVLPEVSKLISKNIQKNSGYSVMIDSGAKGSITNTGQISGCLGLQMLDSKLIKKKINNRALPYFFQNDDSPISRGFVAQPFTTGLTPTSMIMHNIAAREGLIDTAVKTSRSGYIQRKLIKSLEDIMIRYDMTVRNANNNIIQFVYSDNGADTTKLTYFNSNLLMLNNKDLTEKYSYSKNQDNNTYIKKLITMRDNLRSNIIKRSLGKEDEISFKNSFMIPVNLTRIMNNLTNNITKSPKTSLTANYILEQLDEILDYKNTKILALTKQDVLDVNSLKHQDELISKTLFKFALYETFSPNKLIEDLNVSKELFDLTVKNIITAFNKSIAEPGEMAGILSAQTIGEPTTQLVMKTFQQAGTSSQGTAGIPRLGEVLSVTQNIKTPIMTVYLQDNNKLIASKIASHMRYATIKDIRKSVDVYYDPISSENNFMIKDKINNSFIVNKVNKVNKLKVNNKTKFKENQEDLVDLVWLVRIVLDKENMLDKDINLLYIKTKFTNFWERRYSEVKDKNRKEEKKILEKISQCVIMSNSDNDIEPILHMRFSMTDFNFNTVISFLDYFVDGFKLKGINNITNINNIDEQKTNYFDNLGDLKEKQEFKIHTEGVNLTQVRYINNIDLNRTRCNDILEIYKTFGIEAARASLCHEIKNVFGSTQVSNNLSILLDVMTNSGGLTSIDRHGLNKLDTDPLSRASFERPVDQLLNAAVFGQVDKMRSVSSRIMAGLGIKGGTGFCDILLDVEMLEKSEYTEELDSSIKKFNELGVDNLVEDIISRDNIEMFVPT
jgi:DNA-directed RNA polymerase II subunit RPB1